MSDFEEQDGYTTAVPGTRMATWPNETLLPACGSCGFWGLSGIIGIIRFGFTFELTACPPCQTMLALALIQKHPEEAGAIMRTTRGHWGAIPYAHRGRVQ
jgi:hypothetical protein